MTGYNITNATVSEIGLLHISGDIVPPEFFKAIKFDNGKPDLLACLILADILYWYRPIKPRDERTGQTLTWRQRFAGETLQRSYEAFAEKFGATERQARDACARLKQAGIITITVKPLGAGGSLTFFQPIPSALARILKQHCQPTHVEPIPTHVETSVGIEPTHVETSVGIRQNVSRNTPERESHDKERARKEISIETTEREGDRPPSPFGPNDDFSEQLPDNQLQAELVKICGVAPVNGSALRLERAALAIAHVGGSVALLREYVSSEPRKSFKVEFIASDFGSWLAARRRNGAGANGARTSSARQSCGRCDRGWLFPENGGVAKRCPCNGGKQ
jgi:hypothetical protein